MPWTTKDSQELYGINYWSGGHFTINKKGHLSVSVNRSNKTDLYQLTLDLKERGIEPPFLIQFPDIVNARIQLLFNCFERAIQEYKYTGKYYGVFPIKVNQQKHLISHIVESGKRNFLGLECGSKAELLIALAYMKYDDTFLICNGFKDRSYIETALLSQKMGKNTFIVVDRFEEISLIIKLSKKLGVQPRIGFRTKLHSSGSGKWMESLGVKSKFGLTPSEIVLGLKKLKKENFIKNLEMLHFHIGSQVPSIQTIKDALKEAMQVFTNIYNMGAKNLHVVDVGGGLGINYDTSGGLTNSSTNYTEQEYANDVVSLIQTFCDENKVPHPHIVTEAGRATVAHSSVLIFNILGTNQIIKRSASTVKVSKEEPRIVREIYDIYKELNKKNLNEFFNDLMEKRKDMVNMMSYGVISLEQRAKGEDICNLIIRKMLHLASQDPEFEHVLESLQNQFSDTYFCNFSIFQSLPDSWASKQIFPVLPIHELDKKPTRKATLVDLTCDSDGKINKFMNAEEGTTKNFLELHDVRGKKDYFLGTFLTGAYQETLGDLHNLFGDTNVVHVSIKNSSYEIQEVVSGDSVEDVLTYIGYNKHYMSHSLRQTLERAIAANRIQKPEARLLMKHCLQMFNSYTYLEDHL